MKLRVLDLFSSAQAPLVDSASGQEVRGKLGKAPKPYPASCWPWNATRRYGDAPAYARHQERAFLRKTDTISGRLGCEQKTGSNFRLAHVSLRPARSRRLSPPGSVRRILICSHGRSALSIRVSNANDWHQPVTLDQSAFHTADNGVQSDRPHVPAGGGTFPCKLLSTISPLRDLEKTPCRKSRNVSRV